MKKLTALLTILLMVISMPSFSQDKPEKPKEPIKPALLVIDIQNAVLPMIPEQEKLIAMEYINGLIDLFRKNGYPVIGVYQFSEEYGVKPGTPGFEFPETVKVLPTDPNKVLKDSGSNTLFLCGLSAVGCVLATKTGAENHDYKAFMVKNAIMSHNSEYTKNVEVMFDAVSYEVVQLLIENAGK
jgi:nicotinamidase-related amidase